MGAEEQVRAPVLAAVFLLTRDVEALLPFYRDVLGLSLARHEPGHAAWFETGATPVVIHLPDEEAEGPNLGKAPHTADDPPGGATVLWLHVEEETERVAARLEAAGAQVLRPRRARSYVYVRDAEGRLVGLRRRP